MFLIKRFALVKELISLSSKQMYCDPSSQNLITKTGLCHDHMQIHAIKMTYAASRNASSPAAAIFL